MGEVLSNVNWMSKLRQPFPAAIAGDMPKLSVVKAERSDWCAEAEKAE
jgi:hypothetical protein